MTSRWPFAFDLDDIEVTGAVTDGPEVIDINSDRTVGVKVTHVPTGTSVVMTQLSTRDMNVRAAFTRLDRALRRHPPRR